MRKVTLLALILMASGCATNDPVEPSVAVNARNGDVRGAVSKGPLTVTSDGHIGVRLGPVSIFY